MAAFPLIITAHTPFFLERLHALATAQRLLVASDFDGTLAPFQSDPSHSRALHLSAQALRDLSTLPHTTVAVISGRHRAGLEDVALFARGTSIHLVGSHGAEPDTALPPLSPHAAAAREALIRGFEKIAADYPGAFVEKKPFHVVLHVRSIDSEPVRTEALERAVRVAHTISEHSDVEYHLGKCVAEASVVPITKGTWLDRERTRTSADAVLFLGDDTNDEPAFATLRAQDLGIRVIADESDNRESHARFSVHSVEGAGEILHTLSTLRARMIGTIS